MSVKVITVGREFGSGGRSVGKAVAAALGWDYYDQELVRHVAEKTGFAERYIEETGEYSASKSRLAYAFSSVGSPEVMNGLSASDYLWTVQRKVILDLAEKGNCVIVGRCADYILEDRDDELNVFVHAGKDYRAKRIVLLYGETDKPPAKRLAEKDKKRALNYRHYTGREWGNVHNYDLSLDSGRLTPEGCVEIITRVVHEKNKLFGSAKRTRSHPCALFA